MRCIGRPLALTVALVLAGCATPPDPGAPPWRVQPLWRVDDAPLRGTAPGYAALGLKYDGEGRWLQAADAYRKAALADPANAEYRNALALALSRVAQRSTAVAAAAAAADAPPARLVLQTTPTVPALTVVSAGDAVRTNEAVAVDPVPAAAPAAAARVEIVNGNGMRGAAARVRDRLGEAAGPAARLSNRAPYLVQSTVIEYRPGCADQARAIARRMPISVQLVALSSLGAGADVRVVLGRDLV